MKLQLVVAQGVHEGKQIPITVPEFIIGRDAACQLRPASPAISKRHCAISVRGTRVFIRDFGSTNGTAINGAPLEGEAELKDKDHLKIGPLEFRIALQVESAAPKPVPAKPAPKPAAKPPGDDFAAMLLDDADGSSSTGYVRDPGPVPDGSTIMEMTNPLKAAAEEKPAEKKKEGVKGANANTSQAAADILKHYQRRPRQ